MAFAARAGYEVVGVFKETGSGAKLDRAERKAVMALAQARRIDAILVTELSRWGRSTLDLLGTLRELETRRVSVIALNGMAFDLSSATGRMMATLLAGIAEFERDLMGERIKSGGRGNVQRRGGNSPMKDRAGAGRSPLQRSPAPARSSASSAVVVWQREVVTARFR